jgi:MFS transporter, DHA2 family, multidrug resistance protein
LQPSEQGILIDTFPRQQLGMAMALYGVAIVVAPILGPVLGGYISDNYSCRWIFYINVPIGLVSLLLSSVIVRDPPGMDEEVRANWRRGLKIDYIGLALISLGSGRWRSSTPRDRNGTGSATRSGGFRPSSRRW